MAHIDTQDSFSLRSGTPAFLATFTSRPILVLRQKRIFRSDLAANRRVIYLFGDNMLHTGFGGQAGEMRGEENAVGIPTKWVPSDEPDAFFYDDMPLSDWHMATYTIRSAFEFACARARVLDHVIVVPSDGLGTGLSRLPEYAPRLLSFINQIIHNINDPSRWPVAFPR